MSKYRIKEQNGQYWIQKKFLFWWFDATYRYFWMPGRSGYDIIYVVCCHSSTEKAKEFHVKYSQTKNRNYKGECLIRGVVKTKSDYSIIYGKRIQHGNQYRIGSFMFWKEVIDEAEAKKATRIAEVFTK